MFHFNSKKDSRNKNGNERKSSAHFIIGREIPKNKGEGFPGLDLNSG